MEKFYDNINLSLRNTHEPWCIFQMAPCNIYYIIQYCTGHIGTWSVFMGDSASG